MPPLEEDTKEAGQPCHSRPNTFQRQPSASEILNKLTSNSFNRTRNHETGPLLTSSTSSTTQSRVPIPSATRRSNSFFSTLNAFAVRTANEGSEGETSRSRPVTGIPKSTPFFANLSTFTSKSSSSNGEAEKSSSRSPTPAGIGRSSSLVSNINKITNTSASNTSDSDASQQSNKRSRKISERLARTPFLSRAFQRVPSSPQTPNKTRQSSIKIEQRGLMKPVQPPLPRSSTMGNLGRAQEYQSSPHTPSFMRPTSSSERRRRASNATPSRNGARHGSITSCKQRNSPLPAIYPARPSTPSKIPTPVKLPNTPPERLFGMEYSSPIPKTPMTQRRMPQTASERQLPSSRLASRIFPTRKDSLPSASKQSNSRPAEERAMALLPMTGTISNISRSKRNSVAKFASDEDDTADTAPLVDTRIDENEASNVGSINWVAHHRQRAMMFSSRTDRLPSALKKSESYCEPAEEDKDFSNILAEEEETPRRRTQGSSSQHTESASSPLQQGESSRQAAEEAASAPLPLTSSSGNTSSGESNYNPTPDNPNTKSDPIGVRVYTNSAGSDRTITSPEGDPMNGIFYIVRGKPISLNKPCRCGSGRKFKKCCMIQIRAEAEALYGDLNKLAEERGFVALDLDRSTQLMYDREDGEPEARDKKNKEEVKAKEGKGRQKLGGFNITYLSKGRPIPLDESCLCGSEINFKECCMPGLNEQAKEQRGPELAMLRRQHRTVNLELEIDDPNRPSSPESDTNARGRSRAYTPEPAFVAAHPGPDNFTSRHVFEPLPMRVWLGRYLALHDHFRTTALPGPNITLQESVAHPMNDEVRRNRRVFIHLRNLCMTDEAKESLDEFMTKVEDRQQRMDEAATQPKGKIIKAKKGFFEKLKGKHGGEGSSK